MKSIHEIVRRAESSYTSGTVALGRYVDFSMYDTIETIDAYLNSRHTTGKTDALNREKPFFNIVTAATNIWFRATDIDRKDIRILPDSSEDVAIAFVATILLQNWMKEARFGVFLNDWGRALARYGSAVIKFVEKDKKLVASIIPWNRFIADAIDFDALPRIEKLQKTADQLQDMATPGNPNYCGYDPDQVDALLEAVKEARTTMSGQQQDTQNDFIELYEVHGQFPTYLLDDKPEEPDTDKVKYCQQMHVISYIAADKGKDAQDFTLFKGKEAKDPYMITHLIKEDGRTLSIGAVEYLFDAQWMTNHTMKQWKDQLDLASKLIFQTADADFVGRNVLTALETGDILIHQINAPLEPVNNSGHDSSNLQTFKETWDRLAQEVTSTPDAMRGITLPSATAYRQAALLTQAANSFFELMTENKGLAIEDMMRQFIIPFLKKRMSNKDQIVAILDAQGVNEIDAMYVPKAAVALHNQTVKKMLLNAPTDGSLAAEHMPQPFDQAAMEGQVRQRLAPLGNKRFFAPDEVGDATWKEALSDLEMRVVVEVTNENSDKQATMTTLSTVLQTLASNPQLLQDPNAKMVFGKILSETGIVSPLELTSPQQPTQQPQATPPAGAAPPIIPPTAQPVSVKPTKQIAAPLVG